MENDVRQRIINVITDKKISINSLSKGDKALQRKMNRQINEGAAITIETISSILENISNISVEWLITGKGEMEKKECNDIDIPIRKRINELFETLAISPTSVFNNPIEKEKIVRQIEKKESLSADVICAITDRFPAISTEWILRGKGSMLISPSLGNDQLSRLEELKQELDMIKGENRLLREQLGLEERKGSRSVS